MGRQKMRQQGGGASDSHISQPHIHPGGKWSFALGIFRLAEVDVQAVFAGSLQKIYAFRKIFSIVLPFANSSINLSR